LIFYQVAGTHKNNVDSKVLRTESWGEC